MRKKMWMTAWLLLLLSAIAGIFWFNEWKYHLPTPVPKGYITVPTGSKIDVANFSASTKHRPALIHFFNPACPCSRFSMNLFASLVQQYRSRVDFAVVLVTGNESYNASDFEQRYHLHVPVLSDQTLAERCGVYATPQAVVLDENRCLYYRGNYNSSRYCTNEQTSYARMAIDSLLRHNTSPSFGIAATRSYGCSLVSCTNPSTP